MTDRAQLSELYKQNLEKDIIRILAEIRGIDIRKSFNIYYSSKLAEQIENGDYGIENLDARYLAEDLIENESGLFR
jgi:alpha-N-acetylglucosamine transferase